MSGSEKVGTKFYDSFYYKDPNDPTAQIWTITDGPHQGKVGSFWKIKSNHGNAGTLNVGELNGRLKTGGHPTGAYKLVEMSSLEVVTDWLRRNRYILDKNMLITQASSRFGYSKAQVLEILGNLDKALGETWTLKHPHAMLEFAFSEETPQGFTDAQWKMAQKQARRRNLKKKIAKFFKPEEAKK